MKLLPLPTLAQSLLAQTNASPRLVAHLILTHDMAARIIRRLNAAWPDLTFDRDAVLFGAATHDIGKTIYREELQQPGKRHEERGEQLLRDLGMSADLARFCHTHGNWTAHSPLEDLLVALVDTAWKGKRYPDLEEAIMTRGRGDGGRGVAGLPRAR